MIVVGVALRGFGKALKKFSKNKQRVKDVKTGILAGAGATLTGNVLGVGIASKLKKINLNHKKSLDHQVVKNTLNTCDRDWETSFTRCLFFENF